MEATRRTEQLLAEAEIGEVSEIRQVSELARLVHEVETVRPVPYEPAVAACEPAYSVVDPLEGDVLSSSSRQRSEYPCAYDAIAFVEGPRVLTITWLPPAV
jgi:hypothetical protein